MSILRTTVCKNHTVIDLARSQNLIVFCHFGKFELFGWKKIYIWISLPLASITSWHHYQWFFPQVLFPCLFSFSLPILTFFFSGTHLRTCVKQVHHWILFYWTRFKIPWLKSQFVVMWITLIAFDPSVLMKASFDLSIDKQLSSKLFKTWI